MIKDWPQCRYRVQEALKTVVDEDERSKNFIIYVLEGNSEWEYDELTIESWKGEKSEK